MTGWRARAGVVLGGVVVCLVGLFVASPAQAQTATFANVVNYTVGTTPTSVTTGDFNGDAFPDLAVANAGTDNVSIRLNNGVGEFPGAATNFAVGDSPQSVAVGLFNADAHVDLAVANGGLLANNVSILLGNGAGGFTGPTDFAAGVSPSAVAVGNFNADANPDLAVANQLAVGTVSILLGNGTGGFGAPSSVLTGGVSPYGVTVGNFNGVALDLAVANGGGTNVSILLGNGSGGFAAGAGSPFTMSTNPRQVAVGDFTNSGNTDMVTANSGAASPNRTTRRLGNGAGGFSGATAACNTANTPYSVAVGDLDADGILDFVAGGSNVRACIGTGTGAFTLVPTTYAMGTNPRSVALADFNGDGVPDLVSANNGSANVSVRINVTAIPGGLAIMIPTAGVGLGSTAPGGQVSKSIGAVTVANNRTAGAQTWTATVTASSFTTGGGSPAETITNANVSYWSGPALASAQMGTGTFTPGQATAGAAVTLNIPRTAFTHPTGTNANSRAWNPTVVINIPALAVAGTYTGTITHSVS